MDAKEHPAPQPLADDMLDELRAAHQLLMLALSCMTTRQQAEFARQSEQAGLGTDGATRHHERAAVIGRATARHQEAQAAPTCATPPVSLRPGEHYAGVVLDAQGQHLHHLVLMAAAPDGELNWAAAMAWAESVGGVLPTRKEQALLFANCKQHIEAGWHWSSEQAGASYAWCQYFSYGYQGYLHKGAELRARAVRRFTA